MYAPPLDLYAILTSAKASQKAHDEVLRINRDHLGRGLFRVELMTWGKIENLIDDYDEIKEYLGTLSGRTAAEINAKLSALGKAAAPNPGNETFQVEAETPLPRADSKRFSIALTHLTHDSNQEVERLIIESIRDIEGVQILRFDRTLSAEGPVPEDSERQGHESARALLRESSADVLIWGTVLSHGGRTAPRLYWTTTDANTRSKQPYPPDNFRLPEVFWEDLVEILRLLVVARSSELFSRVGRNIGAHLEPFVAKVRNLLDSNQTSKRWSPEAASEVTFILARSLALLGEQSGRRDHLIQSVHFYREIARGGILVRMGDYSTALPNNYGVALGLLGTGDSDGSCLQEAIEIFRKTLGVCKSSLSWATLQNNLGNALLTMGIRKSEPEILRQAEQAYRAALRVATREGFPLDWATIQNNVGYVLQELGNRQAANDLLLKSLECFRGAIEVWTRESTPMYWARAQSNLANSLKILGSRQPSIELLEEACSVYRLALEERAFEQEPMAWAETKNNLGGALIEIADRLGDVTGLADAVSALRESLKVRTRAASPMGFASSSNNLGYALARLGEYSDDTSQLREAVDAFRSALEIWTAADVPARRRVAQRNLGDALVSLGRREKSIPQLVEARKAYNEALSHLDRILEPAAWAAIQESLGFVDYCEAEMETGTGVLESAIKYFESALLEDGPNTNGFLEAGIRFKLGSAQRLLGQRRGDSKLILDALANHTAACRARLPHNPYWAFRAAAEACVDLAVVKETVNPSVYQAIVPKYAWIVALHDIHQGHHIGLSPMFRVVVPGISGNSEPDWKLAPKRGDRIKDGTVIWENGGKFSYCMECKQHLSAPNGNT